MVEGITIRPFEPRDQRRARQLILDGLAEHFSQIDPTLNSDLTDIEMSYLSGGSVFLVAILDSEIVGTGALITESQNTARIVRVSVARAHRRRGVGRKLTSALLAAARDRGFAAVVVETNDDWLGALKLYQASGFVEYDRRYGEVHMIRHL